MATVLTPPRVQVRPRRQDRLPPPLLNLLSRTNSSPCASSGMSSVVLAVACRQHDPTNAGARRATFSLMPPTGSTSPRRLVRRSLYAADRTLGISDTNAMVSPPPRSARPSDRARRHMDMDVAFLEPGRVDSKCWRGFHDAQSRLRTCIITRVPVRSTADPGTRVA